jgi:hypothetical protein
VTVAAQPTPAPTAPAGAQPDGSILLTLSPELTLLAPPETAAGWTVTGNAANLDPASVPTPPDGFTLGRSVFNVDLTEHGAAQATLPSPLTLTYTPPADLLQQAGDISHVRLAAIHDGSWAALPCDPNADNTLSCSAAEAGQFAGLVVPAPAAPLDGPVSGGWFYREANGFGGAGPTGYSVTDDDQAQFWTEFQRLGGVDAMGYPISGRFSFGGFTTQAFQKLVLQWRPEQGQAVPVNVLDELNRNGSDPWLDRERQVPPAADTSADNGLSFDAVTQRHLALLDAYPALHDFYTNTPDAVDKFGLPLAVKDYGAFVAVRLQRATLQLWPQADGTQQVLVGNAADLAKEIGLWPTSATTPTSS